MFHEMWQRAGDRDDGFKPGPGTYEVVIVDGGAFTSRAGDDYAKVNLQIVGGEDAGRRFEHFMGFKHEVGARINREALIAYGLREPESVRGIEDLDDRIAALKGTQAEVGVSYRDDYIQIRVFTARPPGAPSGIPTAVATADDDVPF